MRPLIHATSVAMTSLRREIKGYEAELRDRADDPIIRQRLLPLGGDPEGIQQGFSPLAFARGDWLDQRSLLARLFLFETCSAYEQWTQSIGPHIHAKLRSTPQPKTLQFPETARQLVARLDRVTPTPSTVVAYRKRFAKSADETLANLRPNPELIEQLLLVFRAHKTLRNCLIHIAQTVDTAFENDRKVADKVSPRLIGMAELPRLIPVTAGDGGEVSLRGVIGLTGLVERAARLVDAYL